MNALASYLVEDHINTLLAESAANRQAKLARRSDRTNPFVSVIKTVRSILAFWTSIVERVLGGSDAPNPLVSVVSTVRSLLAAPADKPLALPTLGDYPYRS